VLSSVASAAVVAATDTDTAISFFTLLTIVANLATLGIAALAPHRLTWR
jgi:hypothetical protein